MRCNRPRENRNNLNRLIIGDEMERLIKGSPESKVQNWS